MKIGSNDIVDVKTGSTQVNKVYLGSNLVWQSFVGFLDTYSGAAAAFAFIRLRSGYLGDCIKVRKTVSGTTTELDIGFVDNELDTSAISTFCGSADGFISVKYDQSTNGNNQTQTTATKQPKIYDGASASMNLLDSLTAASYPIGTVTQLDNSIDVVSGFVLSNSLTNQLINSIFGGINSFDGTSTAMISRGSYGSINGLSIQSSGGFKNLGNTENADRSLNIVVNNASNTKLGINGDSLTSLSRQGDLKALFIGNRVASAASHLALNGNIQFEAYYETDQESNLAGIQSFLNNAYSIY